MVIKIIAFDRHDLNCQRKRSIKPHTTHKKLVGEEVAKYNKGIAQNLINYSGR